MGSLDVLYGRIQEAIDIDDVTEKKLKDWIFHGDKGTLRVPWGRTKSGNQRYRTMTYSQRQEKWEQRKRREGIGTVDQRVIDDFMEAPKSYTQTKKISAEKSLNEEQDKLSSVRDGSWKKELKELITKKTTEATTERLVKKARLETFFRNQLKTTTTESSINSILQEAKGVVSDEGLDRLNENAQIRLEDLRG